MFSRSTKMMVLALGTIALSGCAGDGTTVTSEIDEQIAASDGTTAFISRNTGYPGSAVRIFVLVDGKRVASLGNNEVVSFSTPPGEYDLTFEWSGLSAGVPTNTIKYKNSRNDVQYFKIAPVTKGLKILKTAGPLWIISEVTASSFPAAR